jgi:NTE family protein
MATQKLFGSVTRRPLDVDLWNQVDRFFDALPAGVLTMDALERFLNEVVDRRGIPSTLDAFERPVRIIANDLDAGTRVVFGDDPARDHLRGARRGGVRARRRCCLRPWSTRAATTSAATRARWGTWTWRRAWAASTSWCSTRRCPSGWAPTATACSACATAGLLWVYSQSWRMVAEARLLQGLERFRALHPGVALHLVEPDRDDTTMFTHSPMNFAARREILEDAYRRTTLWRCAKARHPLRLALEAAGRRVRTIPG